MAQGYEFGLSDGGTLQLVPSDRTATASISHDNLKIEVNVTTGDFSVELASGRAVVNVPSIIRFEHKDIDVSKNSQSSEEVNSPFVMRTCNTCHGQSCCVTGGCGRCASDCAWVCD